MKISIIIRTCRFDLLKQCIESILKTTDLEKADAEIIVSMNGCEFEAINYIKSLGNRFRFVWVDRRIGVSKATNLASKVCNCEYIVVMDDDVVILEWGINCWLDMLIKPFENEKVGQTGVWLQTSWGIEQFK
jgi:GT2 family glycosyltransferase